MPAQPASPTARVLIHSALQRGTLSRPVVSHTGGELLRRGFFPLHDLQTTGASAETRLGFSRFKEGWNATGTSFQRPASDSRFTHLQVSPDKFHQRSKRQFLAHHICLVFYPKTQIIALCVPGCHPPPPSPPFEIVIFLKSSSSLEIWIDLFSFRSWCVPDEFGGA